MRASSAYERLKPPYNAFNASARRGMYTYVTSIVFSPEVTQADVRRLLLIGMIDACPSSSRGSIRKDRHYCLAPPESFDAGPWALGSMWTSLRRRHCNKAGLRGVEQPARHRAIVDQREAAT